MIVAVTKPTRINMNDVQSASKISKMAEEKRKNKMLNNGGWECVCGKTNPAYTGTCCCGRTKTEVLDSKKQEKEKERSETILKDKALKLDN